MNVSDRKPRFEQSAPPSAQREPSRPAVDAIAETDETAAASADFWSAIQTVLGLQKGLPALVPSPASETSLLSEGEQRLWILHEFQPDSPALTLPFTLRLRGALHRRALEQSLGEISRRHDILRTRYRRSEGGPLCTVDPAEPYRLPEVDLEVEFRALTPSQRDANARDRAIAAAQQPFDLAEPLFRAILWRLGPEEHWLSVAIHHIVFDGWSEAVLFRELAALYRHFATGMPSSLAEPPIRYRDYALWQRRCLTGAYRETLLAYWRDRLAGSAAQELPIDRPRATAASRRSRTESFFIAPALTEKLKAFSRREKVTLFVGLLAGFKLLLYRYTGQESLYVCTPSANRTRPETKEAIGYFVNLLILRTDLSGEPSFRTLLHRVRQVVSGAFAYQDLPVQILMEALDEPNIQLSQVMFALQNMPKQAPELQGLDATLLEIDNGAADFDLSLSMTEADGGLCGKLKYNAALFDARTIRQMAECYALLLSNLTEHPDCPLSSRQLLAVELAMRVPAAVRHSDDSPDPRTETERKLAEIWQSVLGVERVGLRDNFFEAGGHSMLALKLFNRIEQTFGKALPLSTLFQAPDIEKLAEVLRQGAAEQTNWSSLVPIRTEGAKPPIFCIHGIGGNILDLYGLAHHLDADRPFYGLQAVGLDGKQAPLHRIEEMAAYYLQEIQGLYPEGPYCLAGNSMGGVVAFEMAQQLVRQGRPVGLLAFLDTYGPKYYRPVSWQKALRCHGRNLLYLKGSRKLGYLTMLLKLIGWRLRDGWASAIAALRPAQKIGSDRPAESAAIAAIQAAHTQALRDYRPEPYRGRAILFRVQEQPWWTMRDRTLNWDRWIPGGLEVQEVPGNHNNLLQARHAPAIASKLQAVLTER